MVGGFSGKPRSTITTILVAALFLILHAIAAVLSETLQTNSAKTKYVRAKGVPRNLNIFEF